MTVKSDTRRRARMEAVFDVIPIGRDKLGADIADELNAAGRTEGFQSGRPWTVGDVYETVRDIRRVYPDLAQSLVSYPGKGFRFSDDLDAKENTQSREWAYNTMRTRLETMVHGTVDPLITNPRTLALIHREVERVLEDIRDALVLDGEVT